MLSHAQMDEAHEQIRLLSKEIAHGCVNADALEHAMSACDHLRMAVQNPPWSHERLLSRALDDALRASELEQRWLSLSDRIRELIAARQPSAT